MAWTPVQANFDGTIGSLMQSAQRGVSDVGQAAGQYLDRVAADEREKRRQMESDRAFGLQKAAEDRAQGEYDRINKERENVIMASNVLSELTPHLLSKDTPAISGEMGSILSQPTGTGQVQYGGTGAGGTVQVPYTKRVQQGTVGDPDAVNTTFRYNVKEPGAYKEGPITSARQARPTPLQNELDSLLDTKGMYTSRPASSVRDLNQAGMTRKNEIESQIREIMRDKSVPAQNKVMTSDFNSLNLGKALTIDGKPAGKNVPFDQQYVMDEKNNKLVPMNTATAIAQKQQQGIDQASVPNYVNKTGYKDVPINSGRLMTQFTSKGYAPDQVQAVANDVSGRYQKLLSMLPSDNSARREELTQYANMVVSNLGIDPRAFDTKAYVDRLLPKTEMSESQKVGFQTLIHGLDRELDQANKNREFSLEEYKIKTDNAFKNAELAVKKQSAKSEDDYYTKALKLGLLKQELDKTDPTKIAERQKELDEAKIKRQDQVQENFRKYKESVGSMTDAYDYQQWKKAGMPLTSEPGWSPFGTWGGR